jgi:hypothetical protein
LHSIQRHDDLSRLNDTTRRWKLTGDLAAGRTQSRGRDAVVLILRPALYHKLLLLESERFFFLFENSEREIVSYESLTPSPSTCRGTWTTAGVGDERNDV